MGYFSATKPRQTRGKRPKPYGTTSIITDDDFERMNAVIQGKIDSETQWENLYSHFHDRITLMAEFLGKRKFGSKISDVEWVIGVISIQMKNGIKATGDDEEVRINTGTMLGTYIGVSVVRMGIAKWSTNESPEGFHCIITKSGKRFNIIKDGINWGRSMDENLLWSKLHEVIKK